MHNHFEKFSKEAKRALIVAQEEARSAGLSYVGTEHVLLGILTQPESLGASVLLGFGVTAENVRLVLKTVGRSRPPRGAAPDETGGLSGFAKKVIEDAVRCAYQFNHAMVGTEHLLYALMTQENTAATVILENMKVRSMDVKRQLEEIFKEAQEAQSLPKGAHPLEILFGSLQQVINRGQPADYGDSYGHKDEGGPMAGQGATPAGPTRRRTPSCSAPSPRAPMGSACSDLESDCPSMMTRSSGTSRPGLATTERRRCGQVRSVWGNEVIRVSITPNQ